MITVTITATGETVAEALANARTMAHPPHPSHQQLLDGVARPVRRGDDVIGTLAATAESDAEKLAHYTGEDHNFPPRQYT